MRVLSLAILLIFSVFSTPALADLDKVSIERAQGERLATATGHYARARSLLLAALREFDAGLKHANPQVLIDVKEWREDIINRSEDLDKVIAPQPRSTKHGVQFRPDSRLLSEAYR